ncbi:MAG: metal ABC transporter solute-binding protein, Zn/Mn family [Mycobacterium sp.]
MRRAIAVAAVAVLATCLPACTRTAQRSAENGSPTVVASTDVWGSVAKSIAGNDAWVTSVISGPVDPHSFTPAPAAVAAIGDAALVVYNGGGYDAWMTDVLGSSPKAPTVDAYSLLDSAAVGEPSPANEHVFYELGTAKRAAEQIAARLAEADSVHGDQYRSRADEFAHNSDALLERERALHTRFPGAAVVSTEPVAHYLLLAAGVEDKTPQGFSNAVEQDTDPAPADIAAMLDLITSHQVSALVFNDQTVTGATRQIRDAAQTAGVPVVTVTETLPEGSDYLRWQADAVDRLTAALGQAR